MARRLPKGNGVAADIMSLDQLPAVPASSPVAAPQGTKAFELRLEASLWALVRLPMGTVLPQGLVVPSAVPRANAPCLLSMKRHAAQLAISQLLPFCRKVQLVQLYQSVVPLGGPYLCVALAGVPLPKGLDHVRTTIESRFVDMADAPVNVFRLLIAHIRDVAAQPFCSSALKCLQPPKGALSGCKATTKHKWLMVLRQVRNPLSMWPLRERACS